MSDEPTELVDFQGVRVSARDAVKLALDQQMWGNGYVQADADGVLHRVPPSKVVGAERLGEFRRVQGFERLWLRGGTLKI